MEEFLPSEIARAVYGYLLSEGCEDAAKTFLETSPCLVECKQRVKHGKRLTHANTLLLGKNLVEVLNIACSVHSIVKQIHDKQQRGVATDSHESLAELLDQLRSCVLSDTTRIIENSGSQLLAQPDAQCLMSSYLRTPPAVTTSLAENYRSLVQECSEGLDLSLSPEKSIQKNKNVETPSRQPLNRPTSAPGALGLSQLEMDNESAIAAITGMVVPPAAASVASSLPHVVAISSSSLNTMVTSSVEARTTVVVTTALPAVAAMSHRASDRSLPSVPLQNSHIIDAGGLPDPPIIVLNNQNQSFESGDTSGACFNVPPCASSTPQPRSTFMPEDTAFIIYPPLMTDPKPKKLPLKEKTNPRRSNRLRKLLPKPPRQDPPHIIHVKVLPQAIEEENEEDTDEENEMDLAKQLPPHPEEKKVSVDECENALTNDNGVEKEKNIEVLATTSDKENISDENIVTGEIAEKSLINNLGTDCDKETSTPRPPPLRKNISRSTPRRNSHVRALSFNTPLKTITGRKSNTSPKMPRIKFSPRSSKLSCVKRSSLFSPPNEKELPNLTEEESAEVNCEEGDQEEVDKDKTQAFLDNSALGKVPIATRSPAPKLSSAWQEVNDIKISDKPVWDEKIRSFALGDFEDPPPPPKKGPQDKLISTDSTPNKLIKNSPRKSNIQSQKEKGSKPCQRKASRLKKGVSTPSKSPVLTDKVSQPVKTLKDKTNTSVKTSKKKTVNKKTKSSVKDNKKKQSSSNLKAKSTSCNTEPSLNLDTQTLSNDPLVEEKTEKTTGNELPASTNEGQVDTNIQDRNILLEDLVLSSNSCFPQASDDLRSESENMKESSSQVYATVEREVTTPSTALDEIEKTNNTITTSPTFLQPNMSLLETPSKEFQACDPKIIALTTPLIKSIRRETSILEEDLLLTPSLPPTPQINSSPKNLSKTPCKPDVILNGNKAQSCLSDNLRDNETKSSQKDITFKPSPSKDKLNLKSSDEINDKLSNSCESDIEHDDNIENLLPTITTHASPEEKNSQNNVQSSFRNSLTTTTDSSESEICNHMNNSPGSSSKSKSPLKENPKKKKTRYISRNQIYSTTDSSDDETDKSKITPDNGLAKTKLSKLASTLLENVRKSLNQKTKRNETIKKPRIPGKSPPQLSAESVFVNSTLDVKKPTKERKKNANKNRTGCRKSKEVREKSPKINSNCIPEKNITPENMRQQLQSDLLKHERKIIFGEGFPSTSDSESDKEIFETKKNVVSRTKSKKCSPVKKKLQDIVLSEDSCEDSLRKNSLKTGTRVRFESHKPSGVSSKSCNGNQNLSLKKNSEKSFVRSPGKINCLPSTIETNPSSLPKSSDFFKKGFAQSNVPLEKNFEPGVNTNLIDTNLSDHANLSDTIITPVNDGNLSGESPQIHELDRATISQPESLSEDQQLKQNVNPCSDSNLSNYNCRSVQHESSDPSPTEKKGNLLAQSNKNIVDDLGSQKLNIEGESEISITSTCTSVRMTNPSLLDLNRRDVFEVDEGNVTLSYSEIINHHYHSSIQGSELVQKGTKTVQPNKKQKSCITDKRVTFKEQPEKRRIKLIPIEDDKYEKKLTVNYYVIQPGQILTNCDDNQFNSEIDFLDCSTSSILSSENCVKNQSLNITQNLRDSNESKQGTEPESKLDKDKKTINDCVNKEDLKLNNSIKKEIRNNPDVPSQEKLNCGASKHQKVDGDKKIINEASKEPLSRSQRGYYSRHHSERKAHYGSPRNKVRSDKESPSHFGRRERDEESRRDRSYSKRHYDRRYSERWRRESDRRGFVERRNRSTHTHSRRDHSPDPQARRYNIKSSSKKSVENHKEKTIEELQQIEKHDLDRVDKLDKRTLERVANPEKVDPRAAQVLTYSDVERNDSSRDEADSLMDFAVITKTKNNRKPDSSPVSSSVSTEQDPSNISKRKASSSSGGSPDTCHVEKKLKLGEVEMKEAKSVLKHKMADMLNVLHPDTSNEAS